LIVRGMLSDFAHPVDTTAAHNIPELFGVALVS